MKSSFVERGIALAEYMKAQNERVAEMFAGGHANGVPTTHQQEVIQFLQNHKPVTEAEMKHHSRILRAMENLGEILRQLVKLGKIQGKTREGNGVEGRDIIEYSLTDPTAVAEPPQKTTFYGGYGYSNTDDTPETDISLPDVIEGFEEYQSTSSVSERSSDSETEEVTIEVRCEKCCHYNGKVIATRGICHVGKSQQNRSDCPKFQLPPT